jgi:chemotaxis protein methyltransferase CheR
MRDQDCVAFLQWALPRLRMRWPGFRKVRRQVCKRIARRMDELDLREVDAYRSYLEEHEDEWAVLDGFCRISISRFRRDHAVWDTLVETVLPELAAAGDVRAWSVGCASGEEPYTLSLIWQRFLARRFPATRLSILATDTDPVVLSRARAARYGQGSLRELPPAWLADAFEPVDDELRVRPELRARIEFWRHDIRESMPSGPFDLIMCRNLVFTYFDEPRQAQTLQRLLSRLRDGGVLVTGKQEPLPTGDWPLERLERQPIYRHRRRRQSPR